MTNTDKDNEKVVLKSVEGSLAPDIFNDVGTNKWNLSNHNLTVKSQGGNLYLAMRNIPVNYQRFTYKSGVTLEPGTYYISCDIRTAVKGETSMIRLWVNDTRVKSEQINNDWTTFASEFTVSAEGELVIAFSGEADMNFTQDYDVANIMVTKIS